MIHKSHTLFTPDDFTEEEIARNNIIAVNVIEGGLSLCKVCGGAEIELDNSCQYNQQANKWSRLDWMDEVTHESK